MNIEYKKTSCRICNNTDLQKYLDLGNMPLSNNLEASEYDAIAANRYPLEVEYCDNCKLSQLTHVIDPSVLFSYYTYRSSINNGYKLHCAKMAESLYNDKILNGKSFVIDIAGNDGALLREFKDFIDCKILNIDPAVNLCKIAISNGVNSVPMFWNHDTSKIILEQYGKADVITATNVIAHVDDIIGFVKGVKEVLSDTGTLVLEFPYLVDLIERNEFDTVYFEHMSYLGIHPINYLCKSLDMKIYDIEKYDIHGGTVRLKIAHQHHDVLIKPSVSNYLNSEIKKGFTSFNRYKEWSKIVDNVILEFSNKIKKLKKEGCKIIGFAASAKGNTLLNSAHINSAVMDFMSDETPEKINMYSPGTGIPIKDIDAIRTANPDYIVILSWNFKTEIIEKLRHFYDGKFIIPIPKFKIIE